MFFDDDDDDYFLVDGVPTKIFHLPAGYTLVPISDDDHQDGSGSADD